MVAGHEVGQIGEAVEAGVAARVEDEDGGQLHDEVDEAPPEDGLDLLGDHGRRTAGVGERMGPAGQQRGAQHEEGQDRAHDDEGLAGVHRGGAAEAAHPVGDRLQAGERRAAVGERAQEGDEGQSHQPAVTRCPEMPIEELALGRDGDVVEVAQGLLGIADDDDRAQGDHVEVGRDGENPPGLADAAQVPVEEEEHDTDRDGDRVGGVGQARDGTGQVGRTRRRLHGHRDRVVDQQRHRGDLGHLRPEIVPGHHVGSSGLRVVLDDVEVRHGHEEEDAQDCQGDRDQEAEGGQTDVGRHLGQHLLGAVGRGRDAVRGQHTERSRPAEALGAELLGDQRRPEQLVLQPVAPPLRDAVGRDPRQRNGGPRSWTGRHGASVGANAPPLRRHLFAQWRIACCAVACT